MRRESEVLAYLISQLSMKDHHVASPHAQRSCLCLRLSPQQWNLDLEILKWSEVREVLARERIVTGPRAVTGSPPELVEFRHSDIALPEIARRPAIPARGRWGNRIHQSTSPSSTSSLPSPVSSLGLQSVRTC